MSTTGDPNRPAGDRSASLSERVRSLRLTDKTDSAAPPRLNKLPWVICVVLLAMTALFGYRGYRVGPAAPPDETEDVGAGGPGREARPPAAGAPTASAGEVVL